MTDQTRRASGALWARPDEADERSLPFWKALLIAALIELGIPSLMFGVDWSFLGWTEPPPTPVMNVRLDPPPEVLPPPPPPEKRKPEPEKKIKQVEVDLPPPLPDAPKPKIQVPKPEPEPEKKKPKKEEPPPDPEPEKEEPPEEEVEAPPLPSVFQEVKPVRKVRPKYPEDALAQNIEGQVKVRLSVDAEGKVTDVTILLAEPPGVFDESVLEAVRQYRFKRDGTSYQADQLVVFRLE